MNWLSRENIRSAWSSGPRRKLRTNHVLMASDDPGAFDSMRVDDAWLIVRNGEFWCYYKGRQWNNTPRNTKMGVAIVQIPEGLFVKYPADPTILGKPIRFFAFSRAI